jgi:hypothetical protein|tara:strand:- start:3504 stop:4148 length:645 start_codon:yes stop_codon:yes gene_type:complete
MSLKLINGIFFSEHKLENIDNEGLINEVTNTYLKGNLNIKGDRPQKNDNVPVSHTFYEDCPISSKSKESFKIQISNITNATFGDNSFSMADTWGHFTPPLEQTMVHDHAGGIEPFLQLSWVYYPHQPKDAGNICFISTVNESRTHYEVDIKPGHLYLFSPSIMHYVPRNGSGINRISISGNLKSSDKFTQSIKEDSDYESNYWYFVGRDEKLID